MSMIADTHVHLYPCYDPALAARTLIANLGRLNGRAVKAAFLAERAGSHAFRQLKEGTLSLAGAGFAAEPSGEPGALAVTGQGEPLLWLFAGRQIVAAERIEVLALTADLEIPDGLPARQAIEAVLAGGGLPVLSWAPGKWFLARGRLVEDLMRRFGARSLLLGDTSLRPALWPEPGLMRLGARQGMGIVAGSDPLPFAGEERYMGTFATLLEADFEPRRPVTAARAALMSPGVRRIRIGRRGGPLETLRRLAKNASVRAAGRPRPA
jgi:hypothetical protein